MALHPERTLPVTSYLHLSFRGLERAAIRLAALVAQVPLGAAPAAEARARGLLLLLLDDADAEQADEEEAGADNAGVAGEVGLADDVGGRRSSKRPRTDHATSAACAPAASAQGASSSSGHDAILKLDPVIEADDSYWTSAPDSYGLGIQDLFSGADLSGGEVKVEG